MHLNREYVTSMRGNAVSFSSELLQEVTKSLCDRVAFLAQSYMQDILVLGSRDGSVAAHIRPHLSDKCVIYQCDIAYSIVHSTLQYGFCIVVDDEHVPFRGESFDCVVSNLNLHNVPDLLPVFFKIFSVVKVGGIFIAALLGSKTLLGLKKAMISADGERVVPRIQSFNRVHDVINHMHTCGFVDVVADVSIVEIKYRDLSHLFGDMKNIGEGGIFLNKDLPDDDTISRAWSLYKRSRCIESEEAVPVQFEVILLIGRKKKST